MQGAKYKPKLFIVKHNISAALKNALGKTKNNKRGHLPAPFVSTSFSFGNNMTGNSVTFPSSATTTGSAP